MTFSLDSDTPQEGRGQPLTIYTCATNLLEAGQDIRLVQALLDHEDLSTTALYTKVTDARLAGAVAALPPFRPISGLPLTGPASVPQAEQVD